MNKYRKFLKDAEESTKKFEEEFHSNPDKYLSLDDVGDLHIQWFFDRYAALRLLQRLPIFDRAYEVLTERKCYSRRSAFGEMHCDGYMWIEKCEDVKVIVEQRQGYKFIYMRDNSSFHIRELYYKYAWKPNTLHGIHVKEFRRYGFKPYCPDDAFLRIGLSGAFTYGDDRDRGYIASMTIWPEEFKLMRPFERIDHADNRTLSAIRSIDFWEPYLDHPEELE